MMFKLLKTDWPQAHLVFNQLGLSLQIRAEQVSLDQFVRLTQILSAQGQGRRI